MTTITSRSVAIATAVLSYSNADAVGNGETVTIGSKTYTFKTALSATFTEGEVLIGASVDAAMTNLVSAIMHTGKPNVGTSSVSPADAEYSCAAVNDEVEATITTGSDIVTVTTIVPGSLEVSVSAGATGLTWSSTTSVTTKLGDVVLVGAVSDVSPPMPQQQNTVGSYTEDNPNWIRAIRSCDTAVSIIRNGASGVVWLLNSLIEAAVLLEESLTWTPPVVLTEPEATMVVANGSSAALTCVVGTEYALTAASYVWKESTDGTTFGSELTTTGIYDVSVAGTLTITPTQCYLVSNNTNVANGVEVVIGSKTYTFKDALTANPFTEGEVLIGGSADASLLNLIDAINHTGKPNTGTTTVVPADAQYSCAAVHPLVSADAAVAAHKVRLVAKAAIVHDGCAVSDTSDTLTWEDAAAGAVDQVESVTGYYYRCTITDGASTPGSVDTDAVQLTVT